MTILSRILVATDLSAPSRHAAARAVVLAAETGAQVELLHVVEASPLAELRALLGEQNPDTDRLLLDTRTGSRFQGGGFGPTVELDDGTLVTSCSWRGADGRTRIEVIRWRLPDPQLPAAQPARATGSHSQTR